MEKSAALRKVLLLMLCSLVLRSITATSIELGNDEVYYWLYPRYLSWSYFDHPAMIAWVIRALNLGHPVTSGWALRLPALLFGTLNIYIAFLLGSRIVPTRQAVGAHQNGTPSAWASAPNYLCGYYAALLYASSLYVSVICGIFILPDTAQSFFWLLSLLCLVRVLGTSDQKPWGWLAFGLTAGLAILSKYHGVFLWAGAGLYILAVDRGKLSNPYLYIAGLITLLCLSPILYWNSHHGWISFVYHDSRTLNTSEPIHWDNVGQQIIGEFFYNSLPVVALIFIALFAYARKPFLAWRPFIFLLCMSLPLIAFVWIMSGRRETLPHWTGPSYLSLMLLPAAWLSSRRAERPHPGTPAILWICLGFTGLIIVLGLVEINTGFLDLTGDKPALNKDFHKDDFTLDMYGWDKTRILTDSLLTARIREGALSPDYQFVQVNWFNGAHVDFYVARPLDKKTLVLGALRDIHQYYWVNQRQDWSKVTDYCLVTNSREYQSINRLPVFMQQAEHTTDTLSVFRQGRLAEAVFVTVFRHVPPDSIQSLVYKPY